MGEYEPIAIEYGTTVKVFPPDGPVREYVLAPGRDVTNIPVLQTDWRRVLVTGSREWSEPEKVWDALIGQCSPQQFITVIHGDCPSGADADARFWAQQMILEGMRRGEAPVRHEAYPAYWNELDKSAGPIRNKYMVKLGADVCLAFPTPSSRGTISCMKLAHAAGIEVVNLGTLPEGMSFP